MPACKTLICEATCNQWLNVIKYIYSSIAPKYNFEALHLIISIILLLYTCTPLYFLEARNVVFLHHCILFDNFSY